MELIRLGAAANEQGAEAQELAVGGSEVPLVGALRAGIERARRPRC